MRRVKFAGMLTALVGTITMLAVGTDARAQSSCPTCDLANADLAPCGGPDGTIGFGDLQYVNYCVEHHADFCGRNASVCDINCDGAIDFRDYGEALEAYLTGVSSGACVGTYGACCGINQTSCVITTSRACDALNVDQIPGDGVFAGVGSTCSPSACDCNGNMIEDSIDLMDGTSLDCNNNLLPDECDIANGFSLDVAPPNDVPDECDALNRYIFFRMDSLVPGAATPHAIRVTLVNVTGHESFNGELRWAGPPVDAPDEHQGDPTRTFKASTLQCAPYYGDWGTSEYVFITGGDIIPGSSYRIQAIEQGCDEGTESCYTDAGLWQLSSAVWGDIVAPHPGSGSTQPDFSDVASIVEKFLASTTSPAKPRAQLVPSTPDPDRPIDFNDISADVAAFLGSSYDSWVGAGAGPCTCPSEVTCGATTCSTDANCGDGLCVGGFCADPCGRCTP